LEGCEKDCDFFEVENEREREKEWSDADFDNDLEDEKESKYEGSGWKNPSKSATITMPVSLLLWYFKE
jgi:hypothetical protein